MCSVLLGFIVTSRVRQHESTTKGSKNRTIPSRFLCGELYGIPRGYVFESSIYIQNVAVVGI